jgi:hypothetical protein
MSENDQFYGGEGNKYRGSRYPNFSSGSLDSAGNLATVSESTNPGAVAGSLSGSAGTSSGLTSVGPTNLPGLDIPEAPSVGSQAGMLAASVGIPYATKTFGEAAGSAISGGASTSQALSQGASAVWNKATGLLGSGAGEAGAAAGSTAAGAAGGAGAAGAAGSTAAGSAAGATGAAAAPAAAGSTGAAAAGSLGSRAGSAFSSGAAIGTGVGTAVVGLLSGQKPRDAVGSGLGAYAGAALGSMILPGIGTFIGGAIGGQLGKPISNVIKGVGKALGSLVCTELVRQRLMTAELARVARDYRLSRYSAKQFNGYLLWAGPVVRIMRRDDIFGRLMTALMLLLIGSWTLHMAYELGYSKKPHYGGKLVGMVLVPICTVLGHLFPETDNEYMKDHKHAASV